MARKLLLVLALAAGIALCAWQLGTHYPVSKWLFWRYLAAWFWAVVFGLACLSPGLALTRFIAPRGSLRPDETLVTAFALGVVVFFSGLFACGLLGLYGGAFFVLYPLVLVAAGARSSLVWGRRLRRGLGRARRTARPAPLWLWGVAALGTLGLLLVYFPILNPENAAFDSRWQHLGIAEQYAAAGRITRFPEGWFVGTSPHLAAVLYTWAFLMPRALLFDHAELAAHMEFVCFLFTLPAIGALVRRLIRGRRARGVWALRFAFPGLYLYDASLSVAADHIAAVFAVPIFLTLVKALPRLAPRHMILLGACLAGALMTKYTGALLLVAGPVLAILVRALWLAARSVRDRRFDWLAGLGACVASGVALTAAQWLKNWVWYGNPVYPLFQRVFHGHPWTADATARFELGFVKAELWRPPATLAGLRQSLEALVTFSFVPNDWPQFHGKVPVLGSLFTLSILCLPLVRPKKSLLGLYVSAHVGVFAWYWTHHQDRYLQAAMPWFAAGTAAVLVSAARFGLAPRIGAALLIALQVIWGGDTPFYSNHAMTVAPIQASAALLATGFHKDYDKRLHPFGALAELGKELPKGSRVLMHENRMTLGVGAPIVVDLPNNQGGVSYGLADSPLAIYALMRSYGVTHVVYERGRSKASGSLASDLWFLTFATRIATDPRGFGNLILARMPATPPSEAFDDHVAYFGCGPIAQGLYRVADFRAEPWDPPAPPPPALALAGRDGNALLSRASFVVTDPRCPVRTPLDLASFERVCTRREQELWLKKR